MTALSASNIAQPSASSAPMQDDVSAAQGARGRYAPHSTTEAKILGVIGIVAFPIIAAVALCFTIPVGIGMGVTAAIHKYVLTKDESADIPFLIFKACAKVSGICILALVPGMSIAWAHYYLNATEPNPDSTTGSRRWLQ